MTTKHRWWARASRLSRWMLGALTLACIALWIASLFGFAIFGWRGRMAVSLTIGELRFEGRPPRSKLATVGQSQVPTDLHAPDGQAQGLHALATLHVTPLLPRWRRTSLRWPWGGPKDWQLLLPLWIPIVVCGFPASRAWFRWIRRRMTGACLHCGYSLAGIARGAVCPSAGEARRPLESAPS